MSDLRLRAITEIHRSKKAGVAGDRAKGVKATPPVTEVVKATTLFMAKDQDEFDALTAGRYPAAVAAPQEKVAPAEPADEKSDSDEVANIALADMTKAQLLTYAKVSEIEVDKKATVAVILAAIEAAEADGDEGGEGGEGGEDLV